MRKRGSKIRRTGDFWILEQCRLLLGDRSSVMTDSAKGHRSHYGLDCKIVACETRRVTGESGLVDIARLDLVAFRAFQSLVLVLAMREFGLLLCDCGLPAGPDLEFNRARRLEANSQCYWQYRQSQQRELHPVDRNNGQQRAPGFVSTCSQAALRTHV